jgi:hypothetical protein
MPNPSQIHYPWRWQILANTLETRIQASHAIDCPDHRYMKCLFGIQYLWRFNTERLIYVANYGLRTLVVGRSPNRKIWHSESRHSQFSKSVQYSTTAWYYFSAFVLVLDLSSASEAQGYNVFARRRQPVANFLRSNYMYTNNALSNTSSLSKRKGDIYYDWMEQLLIGEGWMNTWR